MADRGVLLSHLPHRGRRGVEFGALMSPFLPGPDGGVLLVDRFSTAELRRHYAADTNVDIDRIAKVDVALGTGGVRRRLRRYRPFDFAIASHVIEHVPDLVGWLAEVAGILTAGGRLLLVVPDKRFTFDYLRQPSTLAGLIEAYVGRYQRPSPGQVFDFNAYAAEVDKAAAWGGESIPRRCGCTPDPRRRWSWRAGVTRSGCTSIATAGPSRRPACSACWPIWRTCGCCASAWRSLPTRAGTRRISGWCWNGCPTTRTRERRRRRSEVTRLWPRSGPATVGTACAGLTHSI